MTILMIVLHFLIRLCTYLAFIFAISSIGDLHDMGDFFSKYNIFLIRLRGLQNLTFVNYTEEPEKMEKFYGEAFYSLRLLQTLSLKKSCTNNIIRILAKTCPATLRVVFWFLYKYSLLQILCFFRN